MQLATNNIYDMTIQENTSVFDLALQFNGTIENMIENILEKYSIEALDTNLTNKVINEVYDTTSSIVNQFYIEQRNISTGDTFENENFNYAEFNKAYSKDYKSL